jgi:hypothetical protein
MRIVEAAFQPLFIYATRLVRRVYFGKLAASPTVKERSIDKFGG